MASVPTSGARGGIFSRDQALSRACFSEVPAVEVEIIARPEEKAVGAGEAAHGPVGAAIANAVADALGVRVRNLPITRARLIAAIESR